MTGKQHPLAVFMAQVSDEIGLEYQRIYERSTEDPGTAGDEGESNWASVLQDWLPPAYHIETKGRLIAPDGSTSPQIDVLVLKPFYPKKLREKKLWLADGVAAAFECKTTLKAADVKASVERCQSFKALFRPRVGSPYRELTSRLIYGVLAHSHSWKSSGSKPVQNVTNAFGSAMSKIDQPRDLIDIICVADLATWSSMRSPFLGTATANQTVQSSMLCTAAPAVSQDPAFRPIGALLASLTSKLAWDDVSIRPLADYYRLANLAGSAAGSARHWPFEILSESPQRDNGWPLSKRRPLERMEHGNSLTECSPLLLT